MEVGDTRSWERTFSEVDIDMFATVSGDKGRHHMDASVYGRRMVQGLLTATLPTRIGGEMDYVARTMTFNFKRPVFVGDTVTCSVTITALRPDGQRTGLEATFECLNQDGKVVLNGTTEGFLNI